MINELAELARIAGKQARRNAYPNRPTRAIDGDISTGEGFLEKDRKAGLHEMWAIYNGKMYAACETAVEELPPGQYTIEVSNQIGLYFNKTDVNLDELVHLPDSVSDEVVREIRTFWSKEEHFRKFGFLWKRGVLLWGPPGSGKTSTIQVISQEVINNGGMSIYISDPDVAAKGLKVLRTVEPHRPIVVMLEDIDSIIDQHGETELLALMDGELQIDNVVFVATTNYPELLDKRFVCRPSRFDLVRKIGMPSPEARRTYLTAKHSRLALPEAEDELQKWVKATNNFSIAHIKELIVSVEVFEVPFEEAVKRLKALVESMPKSSDGDMKGAFGFGSGN
jgi:ATP-dependent 26S proteasome regulatory subunit